MPELKHAIQHTATHAITPVFPRPRSLKWSPIGGAGQGPAADPPRQVEVKSGHVSVGEGENLNPVCLVIPQFGFSDCNDTPTIQAVTDPQSPDMPRGEPDEGTPVRKSDDHADERDLARVDRAFDCGRFRHMISHVLTGLHLPVDVSPGPVWQKVPPPVQADQNHRERRGCQERLNKHPPV